MLLYLYKYFQNRLKNDTGFAIIKSRLIDLTDIKMSYILLKTEQRNETGVRNFLNKKQSLTYFFEVPPMQKFLISGMSCSACSSRIEKAVQKVNGVEACSVSLLTNSMTVEGTASSEEIINAVIKAGYGATDASERESKEKTAPQSEISDTKLLLRRFWTSLIFLLIIMYFQIGMMHFPSILPSFFKNNCTAAFIIELISTVTVIFINRKFFISGSKGVINKAPNMDTLVSIGAGASFTYSFVTLLLLTDAVYRNDVSACSELSNDIYFESSAMILTLITFGKMLEARSKGKTADAVRKLMDLAPKTANVITDGKESTIPACDVKKNDVFVIRSGDSFPADGTVIKGFCSVNESSLTGESIPNDKNTGDTVYAATVCTSGYAECCALKSGEDTVLSQIIKMVTDASATKAPVARTADKIAGIFVPCVLAVSLITFTVWMLTGADFGFALSRAVSVMVISCPCALGLATPAAIMTGNGKGASNGILFKNAEALEKLGKINVAAVDKTGTVTYGDPEVSSIVPAESVSEEELLKIAYSLEIKSEHPISKAIVKKCSSIIQEFSGSENFTVHPGNGITAELNGISCAAGNFSFISNYSVIPDEILKKSEKFESAGNTPVYISKGGKYAGLITVADKIKNDSAEAVKELKNLGIRVVMVTGDSKRTAAAVAEAAGISEFEAEVLPDRKAEIVKKLKKDNITAMVGDGINDAPALASADIGVAVASGTDIAIDSADVVLKNSTLSDLACAVRLSRQTLKIIKQNLMWAFFYNTLGIPIAAGVLIPAFGIKLEPGICALTMGLSSFCVVSNALRLNKFNVHDPSKDKKIKIKKEVLKTMEKTIFIEGMMCPHCEATVKKALEALENISLAEVSHEKGTAVVTMTSDVPFEEMKKVIEEKDFKVTGVK